MAVVAVMAALISGVLPVRATYTAQIKGSHRKRPNE
jgi:hypothetical protein